MSHLGLIAVMAVIVFTLRLAGLLAYRVRLPAELETALRFAPIAVLSALTASSLANQASGDPKRLLAALGAGAIMLRAGRMWVCIVAGMTIYWALQLTFG